MRPYWLIGTLVVGLMVLSSPGQTSGEKPKAPAAAEHPGEAKTPAAELDTLNIASRKMYAGARTLELAAIPIVIIVSGDDLVLRKNGKRTVATVVPAEYHTLKSVAHSTLALFTHLSDE